MSENQKNQNQKEVVKEFLFRPWKVFIIKVFLFFSTLGLGLITAFKLQEFLEIGEISLPAFSLWQFLFYFFLVTLFIFLLTFLKKFKKSKGILFKAIFILTTSWGGLIVFNLWLPDILAVSLIAILIFVWFQKPSVFLHNLIIILGLSGIGGVLGLRFAPEVIVFLLLIFSIYDFIAVNITKHMIKMAKEMIETGTILGLIVPQEISDFTASLKEVKPGGRFLVLGGGDVVFPLLLSVSLVPQGILNSLVVAVFSLFGLSFSFWFFISQKTRQPIPALPPIALFSIIGFLITKLI